MSIVIPNKTNSLFLLFIHRSPFSLTQKVVPSRQRCLRSDSYKAFNVIFEEKNIKFPYWKSSPKLLSTDIFMQRYRKFVMSLRSKRVRRKRNEHNITTQFMRPKFFCFHALIHEWIIRWERKYNYSFGFIRIHNCVQ
jgi:hypothetical protein